MLTQVLCSSTSSLAVLSVGRETFHSGEKIPIHSLSSALGTSHADAPARSAL